MNFNSEKLYQLLPALYRIRDKNQDEALRDLISVLAGQANVIERDIERLYDNLFIETCQEWVVPYIGDLLGIRAFHPITTEAAINQRARVANTLRYRRRKGTATVLEQLAFDTTGWRSRAVEFFELLSTTQYYNHVRIDDSQTIDLRRANQLELLNTAFDSTAHTVDVRHIAGDRGRHNIPNIGLFLWRLQSYNIADASARPVVMPTDGRYTFDPLGHSNPLLNRPKTETDISHLAEEINIPGDLRRRPLYDELESRRQSLVDGRTPNSYYFGDQPVLRVYVQQKSGEKFEEVKPEEILICNLDEPPTAIPEVWKRPPNQKDYFPGDGGAKQSLPIAVAVDPALGQLAFPKGIKPNQVKVSYTYGFSADVGGGPYDRRESVAEALTRNVNWHVGVSKEVDPEPGKIFSTLKEAVDEWHLLSTSSGFVGVITIIDNRTYVEHNLPEINIPEGRQLLIIAARWTKVAASDGSAKRRIPGKFEPDDRRPHLQGDIRVNGAAVADDTPGELVLDGLLIEGNLTVKAGNLGDLRIAHCTLVPGNGGLLVEAGNDHLSINLIRSICGKIKVEASGSKLNVEESIVDNADGMNKAIEVSQASLEIQKSTVFGGIEASTIEASNCIFCDRIDITRRQVGCIRFSFVPHESTTPRCYRCQPQAALYDLSEAEGLDSPDDLTSNQIHQVVKRVRPIFTSVVSGQPAYAQLGHNCPIELRTGADNGAEMGVFNMLKQPQREANLRAALDEYLRFGLEAGIIYVT
jgi:hypothetical protein